MNLIIEYLDHYFEMSGRTSIDPVEANAILDKAGILKDSKTRPGKPLRDLLRKGQLPHAYQINGKGSGWIIPHSLKHIETEPARSLSSLGSSESNYRIEVNNKTGADDLKSNLSNTRLKYKPNSVKYLLIAEAPPNSIERFYYYEKVKEHDYLFLGIAQALYPELKDKYINSRRNSKIKEEILLRFRDDGFYLLDLCELPLSYIAGHLSLQIPALVENIEKVIDKDTSIILIKANVYDIAFPVLEEKFGNVVNVRVPFPGQGGQRKFQHGFHEALVKVNYFKQDNFKE